MEAEVGAEAVAAVAIAGGEMGSLIWGGGRDEGKRVGVSWCARGLAAASCVLFLFAAAAAGGRWI